MGRPRKVVVEAQGAELTIETVEVETPKEETKVVQAKIEPKQVEEKPLKKGDLYLVEVDGVETYWTRIQLSVAFARNTHSISIPKGSPFVPPANSNCVDCG